MQKIVVTLLMVPLVAHTAPAPAFSITCSKMEVDIFKTVPYLLRIDWNGNKLVSVASSLNEKLKKYENLALASKDITQKDGKSLNYAFVTGTFPSKGYKYHQSFEITNTDGEIKLKRTFATIDTDGFVVLASEKTFQDCVLE